MRHRASHAWLFVAALLGACAADSADDDAPGLSVPGKGDGTVCIPDPFYRDVGLLDDGAAGITYDPGGGRHFAGSAALGPNRRLQFGWIAPQGNGDVQVGETYDLTWLWNSQYRAGPIGFDIYTEDFLDDWFYATSGKVTIDALDEFVKMTLSDVAFFVGGHNSYEDDTWSFTSYECAYIGAARIELFVHPEPPTDP